ncbi:MAG: hypothetical protein JWP91_1144 [Fibrobacteres bacterium]|nr:hypothetical protein [Fibrobacterota bacterium]
MIPGARPAAYSLAALLLGAAIASPAAAGLDEKLQLGGLVSLDHTSGLDATRNPDLSLSQVALGANVTLSKEVLASVLLKAEGDMGAIFFDQAMASLHPEGSPWTFLFGQQTLNHGLLSTRLISDPEILPEVELSLPGAAAAYAWSAFSAGGGVAILESDLDGSVSKDYSLVPNLDYTAGDLMVRVSGVFSRYRTDADLALSAAFGGLLVDAESFSGLSVWDSRTRSSGYYLGAEYGLTSFVSLALRHDGLASDRFSRWEAFRYGAGMTLTLKHDLFAACEYGYLDGRDVPGGHRIALQIGLKSTLELPGFQRKTLTQD